MSLRGPHLLPPREFAEGYEREIEALVGGGSGAVGEPEDKDSSTRKSGAVGKHSQLRISSAESLMKATESAAPSSPTMPSASSTLSSNSNASPTLTAINKRLYTIVLDLDETVVYARDGPLYARAHLRELLLCMHAYAEVVVWTAGEREYAKAVLEEINVDHVIQHLIYRHKKWFDEEDYTKDLRMLGRDVRYVLIIENTPDCVRQNPMNGIIVEDYEPSNVAADKAEEAKANITPHAGEKESKTEAEVEEEAGVHHPAAPSTRGSTSLTTKQPATDHTFKKLITLITDLGNSNNTPVPEFLANYPLLRKQKVMGSNGEMIPIFYLSSRRARRVTTAPQTTNTASSNGAEATTATDDFKVTKGGGGKVVKVNRDKKQQGAA